MKVSVRNCITKFTDEQLLIYEKVIDDVKEEKQLLTSIDARGGCGNTFLLNAILASVRSSEPGGCVALAIATTGITANLLSLGSTFHSRMKAPLVATEQFMLQISAQSNLIRPSLNCLNSLLKREVVDSFLCLLSLVSDKLYYAN